MSVLPHTACKFAGVLLSLILKTVILINYFLWLKVTMQYKETNYKINLSSQPLRKMYNFKLHLSWISSFWWARHPGEHWGRHQGSVKATLQNLSFHNLKTKQLKPNSKCHSLPTRTWDSSGLNIYLAKIQSTIASIIAGEIRHLRALTQVLESSNISQCFLLRIHIT